MADLWRIDSPLTWRRVSVLIQYLPPESAYYSALRDAMTDEQRAALPIPEGYGPWSRTNLLLASVIDGLNVLAWQQAKINLAKGAQAPQFPKPVPRPGVSDGKPKVTPKGIEYLSRLRKSQALANAAAATTSATFSEGGD